ncbi:MAG: serine/threonine protein kinase [Acidobacteria bacterium]|nr:serine/threonine protein kinase [Acidobacteriota bacterium]
MGNIFRGNTPAAPDSEQLFPKATPGTLPAEASPGWTLPPKLLASGTRRLGNFALLAGLVVAGNGLLELLVTLPSSHSADPVRIWAFAGTAALSFGVFAISRRSGIGAARLLDLGLVYEVLCAFLFGVAYHAGPSPPEGPLYGWSPIAVWLVVFPLIVPSARGKTLLAATAAALMDPLGLALNAVRGQPVPATLVVAQMLLPTAIAAVAGVAGARIVYRLSATAGLARELGSYRLVSPLGHGGMGQVWRAEHRMLARAAAIKLIRTVDGDEPHSREMLTRFEREARATALLRSPHTIQVYDFGATDDGSFYYVMELLDGFALDDLVRQFGPQPQERVVHLLRQACHSLEEAHRSGLVHRDVKPGNLFLCRYGLDLDFVKVLDFGLVRPVAAEAGMELTAQGHVTGTPSYMAPECALGHHDIDGRADLYALGCVGYYLLTGSTPFPSGGRTAMEVLFDQVHTQPRRPSALSGRALDRGLEDILMSCLAKRREERPESALELATRLSSLGLAERWTPESADRFWLEAASRDHRAVSTAVLPRVPP